MNNNINTAFKDLIDLSQLEFNKYQESPFGAIVVSAEGTLLKINEPANIILEKSISIGGEITTLFSNPKERESLMKKVKKLATGQWLSQKSIIYNINEKFKIISFYVTPFFKENQFLGVLSLFTPSSAPQSFEKVLNQHKIGLFEISHENIITFYNKEFKRILNIPDDFTNINANEIIDKKDLNSLYLDLIENSEISNRKIILKKWNAKKSKFTNDDVFLANLNLSVEEDFVDLIDDKKILIRTKGTLEDITYHEIIYDIPNALFTFTNDSNRYLIKDNNEYFGQIFGSEKSLKGIDFRNLVNNEDDFLEFEKYLNSLEIDSNLSAGFPLKIVTENEIRELIIYLKVHRNHKSLFIGLIIDVTDDIDTKLSFWKKDYAALLHNYSASINKIVYSVSDLLRSHDSDAVQKGKLDKKASIAAITQNYLGLETLIKKLDDSYLKNPELIDTFETVNFHLKRISTSNDFEKNEEYTVSFYRSNIIKIRSLIKEISNKIGNVALIKEIKVQISETLRYLRLHEYNSILTECHILNTEANEFRNNLLTEEHVSSIRSVNIFDVLIRARNSLAAYAVHSNLSINLHHQHIPDAFINIKEHDLYSVFYNIINNAIKYSWTSISLIRKINILVEKNEVQIQISIENFGPEIPQIEIQNKSLFEFAFRGDSSTDRSNKRVGTGIGLWHSNKIIKQYSGQIKVESVPFGKHSIIDNKILHKNTFRIILPIKYAKKNN